MNDNEEREYNDIESLAAYLHSEKMQTFKAAEERAEKGLPPVEETPVTDDDSLAGILFTSDGKKKGGTATKTPVRRDPKTAPAKKPGADSAPTMNGYKGNSENKHTTQEAVKKEDPPSPEKKKSGQKSGQPAPKPRSSSKPAVREEKTDRPEKADKGGILSAAAGAVGAAKNKLSEITGSEKDIKKQTAPETPSKPKERPAKDTRASKKHTEEAHAENISSLSESLSESLGIKAAEIVENNRNSLPPEDIPEVFDVTEGTEQANEFDAAATRLMNAVNDPASRNERMREEMEAEKEEIREEKMEAARLRRNYERQRQGTRTFAYILIALVLCAAIIGVSAYASSHIVKWALDFTGIGTQEFRIDLEIPDDASIETVAAILSENNIISDPKFFKTYADFADKLKADDKKRNTDIIGGKYSVSSTMSYSTLLSLFRTTNKVRETVSVRIMEGMTANEIGALLEQNNVCYAEDFEKYYRNILNIYDFERRVKESPLKMYQLEGYLFPDTYEFYVVDGMANGGEPQKGETKEEAYERIRKDSEENAETAAKKMYSNFNEKMTMKMYKKMGEMHMTLDEIMAVASLVQKEAAYAEDMEYVASVFLNRIRHPEEFPYLQSDVSILYIENVIKPNFKGSDTALTKLINAYNSYVCEGIPAGAVCNPGLEAINAVLYAPETPYFYFCANPETGEIYYAQTVEEHEQNKILAGITSEGSENLPSENGEGVDHA